VARCASEADQGCRAVERRRPRRQTLIVYFDTSAFVKLLVPEQGAAATAELWLVADRRVSSLLLYPEVRSALARAARANRLGRHQLAAARRRVEGLWAAVDRVELTEVLGRRAGDLSERFSLRAYDAVHLASVEQVGDPDTVLASADDSLLAAARALGFATLRPEV
jgi:hypothetical protein